MTAERPTRSNTDFFAAAIHDLRQPLHAIGLLALVLADKVREPEHAKLVAGISDSVQTLESLFSELLEVSRLDSSTVNPRPFAIQEVLDQLQDELASRAAAKTIELKIESSQAFVHSDPVLVERLLRDLIANAIRNTSGNTVQVTVTQLDASLRLSVQSAGAGVIARRLCELLGCPFPVHSTARNSSALSFELPLRRGPEASHAGGDLESAAGNNG